MGSLVVPRCPLFLKCGGCDLQQLSYVDQLAFKETHLREVLAAAIVRNHPEIFKIIPAENPWHYRARAEFHALEDGGWGFYEKSSKRLIRVEECFIVHPAINQDLRALPDQKNGRMNLVWDESTQQVNCYSDHAAATFFTQVNPEQNKKLQSLLISWAVPFKGMRVLELYAGAGNLTLPLARAGAQVTAVESSEAAAAIGKKRSHGLSVSWEAIGSRQALKMFHREGTPPFDLALVDPPREGLRDCASLLEKLRPQRILYVSCNPTALAKDLKIFSETGNYKLTRVQPIDFFPQTTHLETICELSLQK